MNPKVAAYLDKAGEWKVVLSAIRELLISCELEEEVKWGSPTYTHRGGNVIGIRGFKDYCSMWFFKGSLLQDPHRLLIVPSETTQANRHLRFTSLQQFQDLKPKIRELILEAKRIEETGKKVDYHSGTDVVAVTEFQQQMDSQPELARAFHSLTPGRQREYLRYFAEAKMVSTRTARVEKSIPKILAGLGLNDQYKS